MAKGTGSPAHRERDPVAEEGRREHLQPLGHRLRKGLRQRRQIAVEILPVGEELQIEQHLPQLARQVAAPGVLQRGDVLGRDPRPPEEELVVEVPAVEQAAGDGVEEGLRALGLLVLVEQPEISLLQRRPDILVEYAREAAGDQLGGFADPLIVHVDAGAISGAGSRPVAALEAALGVGADGAKKPVVLVEAREDGARQLENARIVRAEHRFL
jgi:hypothetical protein